MACVNHPEVAEVTVCAKCDKPLCSDCFIEMHEQSLCVDCKNLFAKLAASGEAMRFADRQPSQWETDKSFAGFTATVKAILSHPVEYFSTLSSTGSGHWTFTLAAGWPATTVGLCFQMALLYALGQQQQLFTWFGPAFMAVLAPIQILLGLLFGGLLWHGLLRVVGGAKYPLHTTFRALGYAQAPAIFNVIPFVGAVVAGLWGLVLFFISLKEMHETSYGKIIGAFAVLFLFALMFSLAAAMILVAVQP